MTVITPGEILRLIVYHTQRVWSILFHSYMQVEDASKKLLLNISAIAEEANHDVSNSIRRFREQYLPAVP